MNLDHQFEYNVVLDSTLDLKSNSRILNWFRSPPCYAHLLGSLALP
jgi:hypothetical protein